jgi:hypothetical protein
MGKTFEESLDKETAKLHLRQMVYQAIAPFLGRLDLAKKISNWKETADAVSLAAVKQFDIDWKGDNKWTIYQKLSS